MNDPVTDSPLKILILGASYGLLPGIKLALVGHDVTFVGRAEEVAAIAKAPLTLRIPLRKSDALAHMQTDRAALVTPEAADPQQADIILLAMQEPQFAAPAVTELVQRIAAARTPCLSLMNLPPPPFLARLGITGAALDGVYASMAAWQTFDPACMSNASPDPQALRLDPDRPGELTVTLASNFKAAPFQRPADQALLERLARDMSRLKVVVGGQDIAPPVRMLAHSSPYIPLAKWPMLIAGNSRCLTPDGICTIAEAVLSDPASSQAVYDQVSALVLDLGAPPQIMVPFAEYAKAAEQLIRPSSAARAIAGGAVQVERIDLLVKQLMQARGLPCADAEQISARIESRLAANRLKI